MPKHLANHLAQDRHMPGIFVMDLNSTMGEVIEELILIASASRDNEYQDRIEYLPLTS
jgi:hypothetical protein